MKKHRRLLAAVLAVLFLLPLFYGVADAEVLSSGPISTEDLGDEMQLTRLATAYVTKYINTAFLYREEDLTENTLLALPDQALPAQVTLSSGTQSTDDLTANLQHFADLAEYFRYTRSAQGIARHAFELDILDIQVNVNTDTATVNLFTHITFYYSGFDELTEFGDSYTIYFSKVADTWHISDIMSDELKYCGYGRDTFNIPQATQAFDQAQANPIDYASLIIDDILQNSTSAPHSNTYTASSGSMQNNRSYSPLNAIAYAYTYSTNRYDGYNHPDFLNSNFYDYTNLGGNCIPQWIIPQNTVILIIGIVMNMIATQIIIGSL